MRSRDDIYKTMNYKIPNDPHMLFSFVNMMLRDRYDSLEEFCNANDVDVSEITDKLRAAGYEYDRELNQFR